MKLLKKIGKWIGLGLAALILFVWLISAIAAAIAGAFSASQLCTASVNEIEIEEADGTIERETQIWSYLKQANFTDEAAAGVIGNLKGEQGSYDPAGLEHGGGTGIGIVQWSFGRATQLKEYAAQRGKEWDTLQVQLDFMVQVEFPKWNWKPDFKDLTALRTSTDINAVVDAMVDRFERPRYPDKARIQRKKFAAKVYARHNGTFGQGLALENHIIWVGDSRIVGMKRAVDADPHDTWVAKGGMGYYWFVNDAIGRVNSQLTPDSIIVFALGVNDLGNINKYIDKLNELKDGDWKNNKVIITTVAPVIEGRSTSIKNSQIEEFNSKLRKGLKTNKFDFIDVYESIKDHLIAEDGVHFDKKIYQEIYNLIRGGQQAFCNSGFDSNGILSAAGVVIDFNSKYYTYNEDPNKGNPNVCAENKPYPWWPSGTVCTTESTTKKFNKMICSSYASGRYWEIHNPNGKYPLPTDWDNKLTNLKQRPGNGAYSKDVTKPIPKSIVSMTNSRFSHVAFIEGVDLDGSVVISECNVTSENEYGFKVAKYPSLLVYIQTRCPGGTFNGMYGG